MSILHSPAFVNSAWVSSVFLLGYFCIRIHMPPMLGFLLAGFLMNFLGLTAGDLPLEQIADLGIIILLFTIGLKLDLKGLAKVEIWGGASLHTLGSTAVMTLLLLAGGALGFRHLVGLSLFHAGLIAFALSFSSTVFAVKVLEEKGEMNAMHGRLAIGILIMQDLMAVLFLTFSKGEIPSLWALGLPFFLLAIRPVLLHFIDHIGHGEMLPLGGLFIALVVGTTSFALVGLKPDLGALVAGILVGSHSRSHELSASLYTFKDIFLVGFFLQIGLVGIPGLDHIIIALGLLLLLPLKSLFYFLLMTRFRLRARTSMLATLNLSNYSEFGLLVAAIALYNKWLNDDWLLIIALALTFSFLVAAPLNSRALQIYDRLALFLQRFETRRRHRDDFQISLGETETLIFGLGPFGIMAYDITRERQGDKVRAVDQNRATVRHYIRSGRRVIVGDATDYDFWQRIDLEQIKIIMLTMTNHQANLLAIKEIKQAGFQGPVTAVAYHEDQRLELEAAGATAAYNIFTEAGAGYADHVCRATGLVCRSEFIVSGSTIPVIS